MVNCAADPRGPAVDKWWPSVGEFQMGNRVEYSCLAVLLVGALSVLIFYEPRESIQDQHHQPSTNATDGVRPIIMNSSRADRLEQASPPGRTDTISPNNPTSIGTVTKEGAGGLNKLGMMYLNGTGVERDLAAAFEFLSLAAQQGDASAINNLGWMYENGLGIVSDRKRALELYTKAVQLGNELARDNLRRLSAAIPKPGTVMLSTAESTPSAITVDGAVDGALESSSRGRPKPIAITERDTVQAKSDVVQAHTVRSSPDTGWSTGAIPLTRPAAVQLSKPKRKLPKAVQFHRRARRDFPAAQSFRNPALSEPVSKNPRGSKILTDRKAQKNKAAERPRRINPGRKSSAALGILVDPAATPSRDHCAVGNWSGAPRCSRKHHAGDSAAVWWDRDARTGGEGGRSRMRGIGAGTATRGGGPSTGGGGTSTGGGTGTSGGGTGTSGGDTGASGGGSAGGTGGTGGSAGNGGTGGSGGGTGGTGGTSGTGG
jgi:Sel1 repeat